MNEFLLVIKVINCHLSSIWHRFRDVESRSRKPAHPNLRPLINGTPSNFAVKLTVLKAKILRYIHVKTP